MEPAFNNELTFSVFRNEFGLCEITVNGNRIPGFLRPPADPMQVPGGLARHTTIGNYHWPFIQNVGDGVERLVLDRGRALQALQTIRERGFRVVLAN